MPLTALFPQDHEKIAISQGSVGDCYLLATLDCVANGGGEGRERLKSLFTQTKDGVTVRIPRSEISDNLQLKTLEKRYTHSYDKKNKQDVFFISNALLNEIDASDSIGATTNSLAVKILEHLSSYYFVRGWTRREAVTSLTAHSMSEDRHGMGSSLFVSRLINVETSILDIDEIIKLKSIYPDFPVYVAMNWGEAHEGTTHERHALRVERITKTSSDHQFALVNPWHNTKTDAPLSKTIIAGKEPSFSIFSMYSHTMKFIKKIILGLPEEEAKFVARTPALANFLKTLQAQQLQFGVQDSKRVIALYKVMPHIASIYAKLPKDERLMFHNCVYRANGNKEAFIAKYLSKIPRIEAIRELARAEVPENFIKDIVEWCIHTKDQELFKLLNAHRIDVLGQLIFSTMDKDLFLQNLIELETTQTPPDLIHLKSIDTYIKAYNRTNPSKALTTQVDKSLIATVLLRSAETEILEAQLIVGQTLDAVKNQALNFTDITTIQALEERKNSLFAEAHNFQNEQFTNALAKLGSKDKEKVQLIFQQKLDEITIEAISHDKQLKTAEVRIASSVKLFDLPVTFANDFTEGNVQRHAKMFMNQINILSMDTDLQAAQLLLGSPTHPAITQAIKAKTTEITTLAQTRLHELNQAKLIAENTAKKIAELSITIPDLHSLTAYQEELVRQVKLVQALMEESTVVEANKQLGILGQHSLITEAFTIKQQEIAHAIQSKSAVIIAANKKVQVYHSSIRGIASDFSRATTEQEVRATFLAFLKEMERVRETIEGEQGIAVIPSAKTDLLAAWGIHQKYAEEANVAAHNRVIYSQIQNALEKAGFIMALHQIGQRVEATKTLISMGQTKYLPYEQPSQNLFTTVSKARDELLSKPREGKISSLQAKEKIEAFQRKVLVALTSAGKILNGDWQTRLSALQESAAQVKDNFTGPTPKPNPHSFYSAKPIHSTLSLTALHHSTSTSGVGMRSASRMTVVAA